MYKLYTSNIGGSVFVWCVLDQTNANKDVATLATIEMMPTPTHDAYMLLLTCLD